MTMWELAVCVEGVNIANTPEDQRKLEPPTDEEFDNMLLNFDHLRGPVN